MRKILFALFLAAAIAPAAAALNARSAVSVSGSDLNPCTVTAPCRSFAAAMALTAVGGEILALDSAGYGPFTINHTIAVIGAPGVYAAISVSLNDGIDVAAGDGDRVVIRNLVFLGVGGQYGIRVTAAGDTEILDCMLRGFSSAAVHVVDGNVILDRTSAIDNPGSTGIDIGSDNNTAIQVKAAIRNCLFDHNNTGIVVRSNTRATMTNSVVTNNSFGVDAVSVIGTGLINAELTIESCTIVNNNEGIFTFGSGGNNAGAVWLSNNVIGYNTIGADPQGHSFITTFGNNRFVGNSSDGGAMLTAVFE